MKLILCLLTGILTISVTAKDHTVTIQNEHLAVTLAKKGAELQSIRHIASGVEYLWQGDPEYWEARAPNMFPVNVRFKDNRFSYQSKDYEMPRMGLALISDFVTQEKEGEKKKDAKVVQVLNSSKETLAHYPFPFQLKVISQLKGLKLHQKYKVINKGDKTLYFALGGHPGFNTPLTKKRDRNDYEYVFSETMHTRRNEIVDSLIQTSQVDFLNMENRLALGDSRIPNGGMFLLEHDSRKIGIALKGRNPYVTMDLGDFPNTNLWSPPGMPFACVEPMVAHHDLQHSPLAIEEKDFLISLPAGQSRTYGYTIIIHPKEGVRALAEK